MSKLGNIDECMKNDVVYRVTILDGKNLRLTGIWNVPSTCLGSRYRVTHVVSENLLLT